MPSLNVFNNDVAQASLAPPASMPERYAELWWYSGSQVQATNTTSATAFVQKGSTAISTVPTATSVKLYTLNSNWSASTKFALELTLSHAGGTGYAALYDLTSSTLIAASQLSTTSTTATVMRSGQFTLTPGHVYGVTMWSSTASFNAFVTDASLIIFS